MLSSLEGGVCGWAGPGGGTAIRPLARNCWCSRPGRKLVEGRTCMLLALTPENRHALTAGSHM